MSLPNPQTMVDAQAVVTFAQAVSQSAMKLINPTDKTTPEFSELYAYFVANSSKLRDILTVLEGEVA